MVHSIRKFTGAKYGIYRLGDQPPAAGAHLFVISSAVHLWFVYDEADDENSIMNDILFKFSGSACVPLLRLS